ncbi:MAG: hypothetical protein Q7T86_03175 [Hyphomicrobiaceae bacterium]|nr:hypothetical protein [Hyphomicrobiaceae bacterium]
MAQSGMLTNAAPYGKVTAITTSDSTVYNPPLDGFVVGGAGNVAITDLAGNVVTFTAVIIGQIYPIAATKIMSTSTTATLIRGLNF